MFYKQSLVKFNNLYDQKNISDFCFLGFYCPESTEHAEQFSCPAGTYSNVEGLEAVEFCTNCSGGFICDSTNLTEVTKPCTVG